MREEKIVIIGGGIGAMTVALYLLRSQIEPVIITDSFGGKLNEVDLIQNYVGRYNTSGSEVFDNTIKQLLQAGFDEDKHLIEFAKVDNMIKYQHDKWELTLKSEIRDDEKIIADNVVLATGQRNLHLTNIEKRIQHQCTLCDGFMYKDKDVVVIGGGDSAFTESMELAKLCNKVYLCIRGGRVKAEDILQQQVADTDNIEVVHYGQQLLKVEDINDRKSFLFDDKQITADGLFVYIGQKPNNQFLPNYINLKAPSGHVVINANCQVYTNGRPSKNLYAIGDLTSVEANQFGIAIGHGTTVATQLIKKLS